MHLDDERLQRLLHGELEPSAERETRQHLSECPECRARVAEARGEEHRLFSLLSAVDHEIPATDPGIMLAGRSADRGWGRWAAGVALVVAAAGAAYAAPGSPLPTVLQRLFAPAARSDRQSVPATAPASAEDARPGIAVIPGDRLTIGFRIAREAASATVALTDGPEASVRVLEGTVTFASDENRLTVSGIGPAAFEILLPRSASRVEVESAGVPLLRLRNGEVVTGAGRGADGRYALHLAPAR